MPYPFFYRNTLPAVCGLALCLAMAACSGHAPKDPLPTQTTATTTTVYASDVLQNLLTSIPQDTDAMLVAGYADTAKTISFFKTYNILPSKDLETALHDLGTHYQLNPAKLSDFVKNGFNPASGFIAGISQGALFLLLDVAQPEKFKIWFDNFTNEEFGRPTYENLFENDAAITHIQVLGRDYATVVEKNNAPILLTFGNKVSKSFPDSRKTATRLIQTPAIPPDKINNFLAFSKNKQFSAYLNASTASSQIPAVPQWFSAIMAATSISQKQINIDIHAQIAQGEFQNQSKIQFAQHLFKGTSHSWPSAILATSPTSIARMLFDAQSAENLALSFISEKNVEKYQNIKSKFTKKLLKIDISQQIITNVSAIWLMHYGDSKNKSVIAVIFNNPALSDAFFAKLNLIKSIIPENMARITNENGLLHASIHVDKINIEANYQNGLLTLSTQDALGIAQSIYQTKREIFPLPIVRDTPPFMANIHAKTLAALFPDIQTVKKITQAFQTFNFTANTENNGVRLHVSANTVHTNDLSQEGKF